ncbi:hypothetical protein [Jannaschia sp. R86511]|uniref:hypothetical protein n=1 Tax=Jannaschia sp. R86511 TaxID=3093853 RepID=UPI0036D24847
MTATGDDHRPLGGTRGWGPALRLARRDASRHRGRTAAAAVMILVPTALAALVAVLVQSNAYDPAQEAGLRLASAEALVDSVWSGPVDTDGFGRPVDTGTGVEQVDLDAEAVAARVGEKVVAMVTGAVGVARPDGGSLVSDVLVTDLSEPVTDGLVVLLAGELPQDTGEVAVTPGLADRLGARPGDEVVVGGREVEVTGLAVGRYGDARLDRVVALPGTVALPDGPASYWLVDRRDPMPSEEVAELGRAGVAAVSRTALADPSWRSGESSPGTTTGSAVVLAVGVVLVLLEITLLAGPAFAVGVRSQQRTLALVASVGGDERALRRVVLAQGVLVGGGASLVGVGVGTLAGVAVQELGRYRLAVSFGPVELPWLYLLAFVVAGTAAAVAACLVPATTVARRLAGGVTTTRDPGTTGWPWRRAVAGAALLVLGPATMLVSSQREPFDNAAPLSSGILLVAVGMVLVVPVVVAAGGRATSRLPLALRLAGREQARAAARSTAAVAAVAVAAASLVGVMTYTASSATVERREYVPTAAPGVSRVSLGVTTVDATGSVSASDDPAPVVAAATVAVPGAAVAPRGRLFAPDATVELFLPTPGCPVVQPTDPDRCTGSWSDGAVLPGVPVEVAGPDALDLLGYDLTAEQRGHLAAGGILLDDTADVVGDEDGTVELTAFVLPHGAVVSDGTATTATVTVMRYDRGLPQRASLVVGEAAARQVGAWRPSEVLVGTRPGDEASVQALREGLEGALGVVPTVEVERGYSPGQLRWLEYLAVTAATLVLLLATFTTTALALADGRRDRTVMTAVGASPRSRRAQAGWTAALVAGSGAVVGTLVGLAPGAVVAWQATRTAGSSSPPGFDSWTFVDVGLDAGLVVVPWGWIGLIVVLLPVLAGLVVAAVARGRGEHEAARLSARLG